MNEFIETRVCEETRAHSRISTVQTSYIYAKENYSKRADQTDGYLNKTLKSMRPRSMAIPKFFFGEEGDSIKNV